jgi:MoaA/NifB/PqqE/SkfB family radical SAM enzyme
MLHFSLDSPIEEEHNKSRNINCFQHLVNSIEIAKSLGERPDILFTVFGHNVHQIEEVYKTFCKPNNLVLILNPVFEYNEKAKSEQLSPDQLTALRAWATHPGVYLNEGFIDLRLRGGNQINKPVCKAASTTIVISPENHLLLPCYHLGIESFPIEDNLYELWKSPKVQALIKKEGRYDACQGCSINCYMQPSFAVELNSYWFAALPSTIKYNTMKGTWKQLVGV